MQTTRREDLFDIVQSQIADFVDAPEELSQPVELDLSQLSGVSGGLPQGTWQLPQGTW